MNSNKRERYLINAALSFEMRFLQRHEGNYPEKENVQET